MHQTWPVTDERPKESISVIAKSVYFLAVHMLKDARATHQLHCQ